MAMPGTDNAGVFEQGPVRINWTFSADALACDVDVSWQGQLLARKHLVSNDPILAFDARGETSPGMMIVGQLHFDASRAALLLDQLRYPGGSAPPQLLGEAVPPAPVPESAQGEVVQSRLEEAGDLFPYIQLRAWPGTSTRTQEDNFIAYSGTCTTADPRLYCQLAALLPTGDSARSQMLEQAVMFLQGDAPYTGQCVPTIAVLGPDAVALERFALAAAAIPLPSREALIDLIVQLWGQPWPAITEAMASTEFAQTLDRIWQNVFALNCVLGYDRRQRDALTRTLQAATLLGRLSRDTAPGFEGRWPPERLRNGLAATLLLPSPVFPLPAAGPARAEEPSSIPIQPYAIGELHQVKRRLLGYALGEVSHIESVMADERKVRARHERADTLSEHSARTGVADTHEDLRDGLASTLESEVHNALREQFKLEYSTTYGPPTQCQQDGSCTLMPVDTQPTRDRLADSATLARRIVQRAAQRVTTQLGEQRLQRHRHTRRNEVSQCFDRRGRANNQRGVYRWLNARYRCWVVSVGHRLMLEYRVPRPGERLVHARRDQYGQALEQPLAPAQLGLRQFNDLSLDPQSPCYYAALAARYGVEVTELPPTPEAHACTVFESGTPLLSQQLPLPPGYQAVSASIALASASQGWSMRGSIGTAGFTTEGNASAVLPDIALAGQTGALPISIVLVAPAGAEEPSDPAPTATPLPVYGLNIDVRLASTPELLAAWKSRLYDRLIEAWRRELLRYFDAAGASPRRHPDGQAQQRSIRLELQRAGVRGLLGLSRRRTGADAPDQQVAPTLQLWLDQALEWPELTYTLIDDPEAAPAPDPDDAGLTPFLQAAQARVLLPVAPGHENALLYFLATGMMWLGDDALVPTFQATLEAAPANQPATLRYLDLADDLKVISATPAPAPQREAWELMVATDISVLQDGEALPDFKDEA